eukprot:CAMPEP_0175872692 /NCGR_PEP_ID=MMETSP0107_2-20121207/37875_1 /TAXON_ID=195067 ORGANISM="Goniomonas pacifica, Strain CCMP1869" /NCGR_SAMPLE_ID=MMETSP0107_2 /ASSEMBLY_ACC=CAM_ASM_000203 /LENGTH=56 /DNA_ID=CAMNT_0017191297 /DNA_START=110 /DNA_END=276 /DNA_ORIENTATION=+
MAKKEESSPSVGKRCAFTASTFLRNQATVFSTLSRTYSSSSTSLMSQMDLKLVIPS